MQAEGFLKPAMKIEVQVEDGAKQRFTFDTSLASPLPRPLAAKAVNFVSYIRRRNADRS